MLEPKFRLSHKETIFESFLNNGLTVRLISQTSRYLPAFYINWCFLQLAQSESKPLLLVSVSGRATCINTVSYFPSLLETETAAKIRSCLNSLCHLHTDVTALL